MIAIDMIVLGVILIFGIFGLVSGVIKMTYKVASYLLSIILAVKFAKPIAEYFKTSDFYQNILNRVHDMVNGRLISAGVTVIDDINSVLDQLPLPQNIKEALAGSVAESSASAVSTNTDSVIASVSTGITDFLMIALAGILLFIVIKILFMFIGILVDRISKTPIIKQLDKGLGLILGCVIGLLIIFSLFTGLTMLSSTKQASSLIDMIDESIVADYLYHNNPINNMLANKM